MGAVRVGPDERLVLALRDKLGLKTFIETGTCNGNTSAWAAKHFEHVITIELSGNLYTQAKARLAGNKNVRCLLGHSAGVLAGLFENKQVVSPAIAWLDAHWCGGGTAKGLAECPVTEEIKALGSDVQVVMADDARMFLRRPPSEHCAADWPDVGSVCGELYAKGYGCRILDDVIVAVQHGNIGLLDKAIG